ncbi:MAG: hypothetical protein ACK4SQ_16205 [Allorhizobium sp.]
MNQHARRPKLDPEPPRLTDAQKDLCALAKELVPQIAPVWTKFYDTENHAWQIFIDGDVGPKAAPLALVTEEAGWADKEFLTKGAQMLAALVAAGRRQKWIIEQQDAEIRRLRGEPDPSAKKFSPARQCAIYCSKPDFQQWLRDVHGADISDLQRVETRVRSMLMVESRAELDENPEAASRWQKMRKDFEERAR